MERETGQVSLFGDDMNATGHVPSLNAALPVTQPWPDAQRLAKEKEILGFYISGHPLEPFRTEVELFGTHTVSQLGGWSDQPIALGAVVTGIKRQTSKRTGAEFARLTVEDFSGSCEVTVFPEAWILLGARIKADVPVLLKGGYPKRDQGSDNPTFIVDSVTPFAELRAAGSVGVLLDFSADAKLPAGLIGDVRDAITLHAGSAPIEVRWNDGNGTQARLRSRSLRVSVTSASLQSLRALLGQARVKLIRGS